MDQLAAFSILAAAPGALDMRNLGTWLIVLAGISLLPFVLTMITSFAKLVIVGGIIRQALGTQNIPPNTVITGLALILTIHIMSPVASKAYDSYRKEPAAELPINERFEVIVRHLRPPLSEFLAGNASPANVEFFSRMSQRLAATRETKEISKQVAAPYQDAVRDLTVLAPAFILTELTEAFQVGFLIYVPFLVIDLVVANILLTLGMQSVQPTTIALPLKLLLFVLVDGWRLIFQGLMLGYAVGGGGT